MRQRGSRRARRTTRLQRVGSSSYELLGETMLQGVHADALVDPGPLCGDMNGAIELPRTKRCAGCATGKQPRPWPLD